MLPNQIEDKIMRPFNELSDEQRAMYVELAKIINYYNSVGLSQNDVAEVLIQLNTSEKHMPKLPKKDKLP
jgi:hypothetical protein